MSHLQINKMKVDESQHDGTPDYDTNCIHIQHGQGSIGKLGMRAQKDGAQAHLRLSVNCQFVQAHLLNKQQQQASSNFTVWHGYAHCKQLQRASQQDS